MSSKRVPKVGRDTSRTTTIESKPAPSEEQIRDRAYQLFVQRGCVPGNPALDWLDAELQLRHELRQAA